MKNYLKLKYGIASCLVFTVIVRKVLRNHPKVARERTATVFSEF